MKGGIFGVDIDVDVLMCFDYFILNIINHNLSNGKMFVYAGIQQIH